MSVSGRLRAPQPHFPFDIVRLLRPHVLAPASLHIIGVLLFLNKGGHLCSLAHERFFPPLMALLETSSVFPAMLAYAADEFRIPTDLFDGLAVPLVRSRRVDSRVGLRCRFCVV